MKLDHLTRAAVQHTLHCLTGCAIGEILGMVLATAWGWGNLASIALAVGLAFFFGYGLTFWSVYRRQPEAKSAAKTAVATDTASIATMETVDNLFILAVPGALEAELNSGLFWWSLILSLVVAFFLTVPVNRWFIAKSGHAHHQH